MKLFRLPYCGLLGLILVSCASTHVSKIEVKESLAKSVDENVQKKFEVQDAPVTPPVKEAEKVAPPPKKVPHSNKLLLTQKKTKDIPDRRAGRDLYPVGEKLVYDVTYFGMAAGELTMEILPSKFMNNRPVYHFRASAKSSQVFNMVYTLDDTFESFVDRDGLFSYKFRMVLDQSKLYREAVDLLDFETGTAYYASVKNHVEKGKSTEERTIPIAPLSQDGVSAIYYLRALPLEMGKQYIFPIVAEGKTWDAIATVVKKEELDTPLGKRMCIVIRPQTRFQGVIKQERGDSFIWLTDDADRFMVKLEAKVKIGTVVARLKSVGDKTK